MIQLRIWSRHFSRERCNFFYGHLATRISRTNLFAPKMLSDTDSLRGWQMDGQFDLMRAKWPEPVITSKEIMKYVGGSIKIHSIKWFLSIQIFFTKNWWKYTLLQGNNKTLTRTLKHFFKKKIPQMKRKKKISYITLKLCLE